MKKSLLSTIATLLLLFSITACAQQQARGSQNYITQKVDVPAFEGIKLAGSLNVTYTQKPGTPSVEVYAPDNIVPLIETYVEDGNLIVRYKRNTRISHSGKVEVRVATPTIQQMSVSGSGGITLANGVNTKDLSITVSGSGDINGNKIKCANLSAKLNGSGDINLKGITAENTEAYVSGSGDISLTGNCVNAEFNVNGSGDINGVGLKTQNASTMINGSGDINCYATEWLKGSVNGSGEVGYKGSPRIEFSKKGLHKL